MTILRTMTLTACAVGTLMFSAASIANHSWGNYHWARSTNPIALNVAHNVDSEWESYLGPALDDWDSLSTFYNYPDVLSFVTITPSSGSTKPCKAEPDIIKVCNDTYGYNGWLGLASISVSNSHITAAYVKLNDSYFASSTYNTSAWRQMVTCQEVGHTFGLDHQDENFDNDNLGTCMDYTSNPAGPLSNEHPNAHDFEELATIYEHLDGSSSGGTSDGGSGCNPKAPWCNGASAADILANIEMNGPAQWGRLVSEHGPLEVYELDFGGGRKVITFVTWTLEHAYNHKH